MMYMIFSSLFAVMNANRLLLQGNPIIPAVPSEFGQSTAVQNGGNPPIEPVEPIEPIEPAPSSAAPLDINCNVGYGQAADPADPGYCARVVMELKDCSFPLITEIIATTDYKTAFTDIDVALLIGARPRGKGMVRADLLKANANIFKGIYFPEISIIIFTIKNILKKVKEKQLKNMHLVILKLSL